MSLRQFVPAPYKAPWSHSPGIEGWISGSSYFAKIFPSRLELYSCVDQEKILACVCTFPELALSPDWTVFFDSLRQVTIVQGHAKTGFFRYHIEVEPEGIFLRSLKSKLVVEKDLTSSTIQRGEKVLLVKSSCLSPRYLSPRLHLGVNKDPNLDRIFLKPDLLEVLPLWYQLAAPLSFIEEESSLLSCVAQKIREEKRGEVFDAFMNFFRAGMSGYFVPKVHDDLYLGFESPPLSRGESLSKVHGYVASLIRSMFFRQEGSALFILPCLPKGCLSGRLLRERLSSLSQISLEWRKECIRRIVIHSYADEELFILPAGSMRRFYMTVLGEKSSREVTSNSSLALEKGKRYLFDSFEH